MAISLLKAASGTERKIAAACALEKFGVREHFNENTTDTHRMLTDGRNYLWVTVVDGLVHRFTRYFPNGAPGKILQAIEDACDVDIVSEHQPQ